MPPRHERIAELHRQLAELNAKGRQTAPGSPEREALLEQWSPIHTAVLVLSEQMVVNE